MAKYQRESRQQLRDRLEARERNLAVTVESGGFKIPKTLVLGNNQRKRVAKAKRYADRLRELLSRAAAAKAEKRARRSARRAAGTPPG